MQRGNVKSYGFTLLEMAIILIIMGFFMAAIAQVYASYYGNMKYQQTEEKMKTVDVKVREFFGLFGRYPCPADPNLPPDDPDFGLELCRPAVTDPCPTGLFCQNLVTRDTLGDADADPDFVMIGAVPVRTLSEFDGIADFSENAGVDDFGSKLRYGVTELMTRGTPTSPANFQMGAIDVRDENNRSIVLPEQTAHFVIVSHGENRKGAYAASGDDLGGCDFLVMGVPTTAPAGNSVGTGFPPELENCDDDDGLFVSALRSQEEDNYFDDIVYIGSIGATNLWRTMTVAGNRFLYNTNLGNVGVGTTTPTASLHVEGSLMAEESIEVPEDGTPDTGYCDPAGDFCVKPSFLGGTADPGCPAGQVATGISENTLLCTTIPPVSFTCPVTAPPSYATGFRLNQSGVVTPICSPL